MSGLSEAALHVQAMRFVCKALADREQQAIEVDWDVLRHMLNMLETIFQGIENQRDDDRDELMHTRKDRDHWRQARDTAIEGGELLMKSNQTLQADIETLRKELADAQRAVSDAFAEVNSVRQQLDAARAAVTLQRAGIERLAVFVWKVRTAVLRYQPWCEALNQITAALAELDAEPTEPAPVAEPVPCRERELSEEMQDAVPPSWAPLIADLRRRLRESQQELERLQAFVAKARQTIGRTMNFGDVEFLLNALAELDTNLSATLTSSVVKESLTPAPVAEPLDAEGDTCPGK